MTKHLADHREPTDGGRLKHFLRLARDRSDAAWQVVKQRPRTLDESNRRVLEYIRIDRGRRV